MKKDSKPLYVYLMFGYQLIDLLLFDGEVLQSQIAEYNEKYFWLAYVSLGLTFFGFIFNKAPWARRLIAVLPVIGWFFSGHFFYQQQFISVYPASFHLGLFCMLNGIIALCLTANTTILPTAQYSKIVYFSLATLIPAAISYIYNPDIILTIGTSSFIAALGSICLYWNLRSLLARFLTLSSLIWCILLGLVVMELR